MKIFTFCYLLIDEESPRKIAKAINIFIMILIFINIIAVIAESFEELQDSYEVLFRYIEVCSVIVFTIEYILRLLSAPVKYRIKGVKAFFKYVLSPLALIDLLAILPFYIPLVSRLDLRFLRILRVTRLLRIFKIQRYTKALSILVNVLKRKKNELGITILVTLLMLLLTASIMYYAEHEAQPDKFTNILSSLWWAVATLTTIGYGDVFPITTLGKLLGGIIAILGIGLIALPTGIISSGFIEEINSRKADTKKVCPHCGKDISE